MDTDTRCKLVVLRDQLEDELYRHKFPVIEEELKAAVQYIRLALDCETENGQCYYLTVVAEIMKKARDKQLEYRECAHDRMA